VATVRALDEHSVRSLPFGARGARYRPNAGRSKRPVSHILVPALSDDLVTGPKSPRTPRSRPADGLV
jgi:hypothetical protein